MLDEVVGRVGLQEGGGGLVVRDQPGHGEVEQGDAGAVAWQARVHVVVDDLPVLLGEEPAELGVQVGAAGGLQAQFQHGEVAGAVAAHPGQQLAHQLGGQLV